MHRRTVDLHGRVRLHREEMVVAPGEVGRADNHETADVTVRRNVADLREAAWTEEALALHLRVTYAERGWRRVW